MKSNYLTPMDGYVAVFLGAVFGLCFVIVFFYYILGHSPDALCVQFENGTKRCVVVEERR